MSSAKLHWLLPITFERWGRTLNCMFLSFVNEYPFYRAMRSALFTSIITIYFLFFVIFSGLDNLCYAVTHFIKTFHFKTREDKSQGPQLSRLRREENADLRSRALKPKSSIPTHRDCLYWKNWNPRTGKTGDRREGPLIVNRKIVNREGQMVGGLGAEVEEKLVVGLRGLPSQLPSQATARQPSIGRRLKKPAAWTRALVFMSAYPAFRRIFPAKSSASESAAACQWASRLSLKRCR